MTQSIHNQVSDSDMKFYVAERRRGLIIGLAMTAITIYMLTTELFISAGKAPINSRWIVIALGGLGTFIGMYQVMFCWPMFPNLGEEVNEWLNTLSKVRLGVAFLPLVWWVLVWLAIRTLGFGSLWTAWTLVLVAATLVAESALTVTWARLNEL